MNSRKPFDCLPSVVTTLLSEEEEEDKCVELSAISEVFWQLMRDKETSHQLIEIEK